MKSFVKYTMLIGVFGALIYLVATLGAQGSTEHPYVGECVILEQEDAMLVVDAVVDTGSGTYMLSVHKEPIVHPAHCGDSDTVWLETYEAKVDGGVYHCMTCSRLHGARIPIARSVMAENMKSYGVEGYDVKFTPCPECNPDKGR